VSVVRNRLVREGYRTEVGVSTGTVVNKAFIRFPGIEREMGLPQRVEKKLSLKVEVYIRPPAGSGLEITTIRRYVALRLSDPEWPAPNLILLANALRQAGHGSESEAAGAAANWKQVLAERLGSVPWDGVRGDVERFLERPGDVWMIERETVLGLLSAARP